MVSLKGRVEGIIYRNDENGYTVFVIETEDNYETVTGAFPLIREGDIVIVNGMFVDHELYGTQFKATSYELAAPESCDEIESYLASGIVKGVGPKMARDIVDAFGKEALNIIEKEPHRLTQISGIGEKKAASINESLSLVLHTRRTVMFLQKFGIGARMAVKIYALYGDATVEALQANPYRLVTEVDGVGFLTADKMASSMGLDKDSGYRLNAAIHYVLSEAGTEGHTYLPEDVLADRVFELTAIPRDRVRDSLEPLALERSVDIARKDGVRCVYEPPFFRAESHSAMKIIELRASFSVQSEGTLDSEIDAYQLDKGISLAQKQREAVKNAIINGVSIITGGPGTGKTTTLDCILHLFRKRGAEIALAAPTGRAAKRMSNATGDEAKTIHRLLEFSKNEDGSFAFHRNKENPVECQVCIVDEASMIDIFLFNALVMGLKEGTQLIFVGDSDQLPSVGAGNVLADLISSRAFPVTRLDQVFRQASKSTIITNAHRINNGEYPIVNVKGGDFFLDRRASEQDIAQSVVELVKERLPKAYSVSPYADIQVLTPIKKGVAGVNNLNKILQASLNPPDKRKKEHVSGEDIFRVGDKVMQIRNNYDREWTQLDRYGNITHGTGLFNGDAGIIRAIDTEAKEIEVVFEDQRESVYNFADVEEITLSYAISVHKSQGCEFPMVVIPLPASSRRMLNRNLLYTAVTRASKLAVLVGSEYSVQSAVNNIDTQKRYSTLVNRLNFMLNVHKLPLF